MPTIGSAEFSHLLRHPSRAAAGVIGQSLVLEEDLPAVQIRGLDILANMLCDWSVSIYESAINAPGRWFLVRRYALHKLVDLVHRAINCGYAGLSVTHCRRLERSARAALNRQKRLGRSGRIKSVAELCRHLKGAVAQGWFGQLADF
jgi:hypothetical protein